MLKCLLPYSEIFNTLFPERLLPVQMSRTLRINAEPYEFEFQPARCALLIIDMQRDFLEPGGFGEMLGDDVSQLRRTIDPNRKLLAAWRSAGLQVNTHARGAPTGPGGSAAGKKDSRARQNLYRRSRADGSHPGQR
jgi:Isochorismatase family